MKTHTNTRFAEKHNFDDVSSLETTKPQAPFIKYTQFCSSTYSTNTNTHCSLNGGGRILIKLPVKSKTWGHNEVDLSWGGREVVIAQQRRGGEENRSALRKYGNIDVEGGIQTKDWI